jgi:hypothetical protein
MRLAWQIFPGNPLPTNYEIAKPQTYDFFDISTARIPAVEAAKTVAMDAALKASAPTLTGKPQKKMAREPWDDSNKKTPEVKEKDKDKFEGPDKDSGGGLTGTTEAKPTIEKFAGTQEAVDATNLDIGVTREKRAVWVVHGMGQQIPFETLDRLANDLLDVLPNPTQIIPRLRTVKIADQVLQRVELDVDGINKDNAGKPLKQYELHLYETYWAPKTEGVAKLTDVVSFLRDGGLHGILNSIKSFQRAMFGGMATFSIRWLTPLWLCLALLILVALTAINAVVLAAAGAQTGLAPLAFFKAHWAQLTALASCMVAVAFSFGAMLFVADLGKPQELTTPGRILVGAFCWIAMLYTIFNILGTAALTMAIFHVDWISSSDSPSCPSPAITGTCIAGTTFQNWIHSIRNFVAHLLEKMPCAQLQGFATLVILIAALLVAVTMITRAVLRSSEKRLQGHWLFMILSVLTFAVNVVAFFGSVLMLWGHLVRWTLPPCLHFFQNPVWVGRSLSCSAPQCAK